jgi:hypothetical protein
VAAGRTGGVSATVEELLSVVARGFGIDRKAILGKGKQKSSTIARHIACLVLRDVKGMSFPEIGTAVGNRHHTTAMDSVRKGRALVERHPDMAEIAERARIANSGAAADLTSQDRLVRLQARRRTVSDEIARLSTRLGEIDRAIESEKAALTESGIGEAEGVVAAE